MQSGVISDEMIRLTGPKSSKHYPEPIRMVTYEDFATSEVYRFITNNTALDPLTISELYRERWQVGVSREGHIIQSVKVRPRLKDPNLVAWEAPWRETKTVKPSDKVFIMENMQHYQAATYSERRSSLVTRNSGGRDGR